MFDRLFRRKSAAPTLTPTPPAEPPSLSAMRRISGLHHAVDVDRVVVVDTETTGLYTSDRVIEVAAVTFDRDGAVIDEWDTLINPRRDVGPTWLHGITESMVADAPTFEDVAATLASRLHRAVVVAHNLPFDARLLRAEYDRLGASLDVAAGIDTLRMTRCKLDVACEEFGIRRTGAHQALSDARATGELLFHLASTCVGPTAPAQFLTGVPNTGLDPRHPRVTGESYVSAPPTWLAGLAAALRHDAADVELVGYLDVLNLAMADLHLDEVEREELASLAQVFGLSPAHVMLAHRRWLDDLLEAATADGAVDADEYDVLCRAAAVLGVEQGFVDTHTARHRTGVTTVSLEGCSVCFTGEPVDAHGLPIPRDKMERHALNIGLTPANAVTKSGCQLLVAADPQSMSGKAGNARRFGIPIVSATDFLAATRGDSLVAQTILVEQVDTRLCPSCGRAWTQPRGRGTKPKLCDDCRTSAVAATTRANPKSATAAGTSPAVEVLTCVACHTDFDRVRTRGRKPMRCPDCAGK